MESEITSVGGEQIQFLSSFSTLNLWQDLEDNLFEKNSEYEDCECNSNHVNHCSERLFDTTGDEEMSCLNFPFGRNKKKKLRGKGGWKVNNNDK